MVKVIHIKMHLVKLKVTVDIKEVTNVEDLFFEFLRVADVIKPKVIIAENVAGLTICLFLTIF